MDRDVDVLSYVRSRYHREYKEAMGMVSSFTCWYDVEKYLASKGNDTLEKAFRNSIVKWVFVSVMECAGDGDTAYRIGSAWTTCGLCLHFKSNCEDCPLKDDGVVCCEEYSRWVRGYESGKEVLRRIVETYERWKGESGSILLEDFVLAKRRGNSEDKV